MCEKGRHCKYAVQNGLVGKQDVRRYRYCLLKHGIHTYTLSRILHPLPEYSALTQMTRVVVVMRNGESGACVRAESAKRITRPYELCVSVNLNSVLTPPPLFYACQLHSLYLMKT
jgi:hypothetical protein